MKRLITIALAATFICVFYSCQRYPYLSYYIKVVDKNGNSVLDTVSAPGKINVNDLWFEVITGDYRDTLRVTGDEEEYTAEADTTAMDEEGDSTVAYSEETAAESHEYQYEVKFNNYDRPHLWANTSIPIGIELAKCPVFVIHWTDGKTDSLQIDNEAGTLADPVYYVNGKKVKSEDQFITIVK